jgi:protein translocase SecG subunit
MVHLLSIVQITFAILLIVLIIVQRANTDASGALGADGGTGGATLEKRGAEKMIHRLTVIVAVIFAASFALPLVVGA